MSNSEAVESMGKSVRVLFASAGLAAIAAIWSLYALSDGLRAPWVGLLAMAATALTLMGRAGRLVSARQRRIDLGQPDQYLTCNAQRSETAVLKGEVPRWSSFRRYVSRRLFDHHLMVADTVRIKSLSTIRATLDEHGSLDGLPFMREMEAFCGRTARVYRVVDKIYDYGRSRLMRRLDGCVLLTGLRCDGSDHGRCEAACYLIWKADWLERVDGSEFEPIQSPEVSTTSVESPVSGQTYRCQYTQLTSASRSQASNSLHGLLGPLVVGNVSSTAFLVAVQTRLFNAFQARRRGVGYPSMPAPGREKNVQGPSVKPGDWVQVRTSAEIARSLDQNSKNRGLWFDKDMLKFCGQSFQVRGKVKQIIDISSLTMIPMKTPCIMLETVHFTGELQGFGEQHDYLYWREAWLQPIDPIVPTL